LQNLIFGTQSARVYIEGSLRLDEWVGQDGNKRYGLSVMSWHCRLSKIGRSKPPCARDDGPAERTEIDPPPKDSIPF
jgi:single-stranded DNA-binding protein